MNIFALIASIINKILSFSLFPSATLDIGTSETALTVDTTKRDTEAFKRTGEQIKGRCLVSRPENINPNARFTSTGSPAWEKQWAGLVINGVSMQGRHGGTDFLGPQGTAVYAPFDMQIVNIGHYSDSGRYGDYIVATTSSGLEYYSGHLQSIRVHIGDSVKCGAQIGEMNVYAHTHIQIKRNGQIIDPESVLQ